MQKSFFLQQEELMILSALFGINQIYGIKGTQLPEEQVPYKIHQMTRAGIFELKGIELFVHNPYQMLMQKIKESSLVMEVQKNEKAEQKIWFYIGTSIVCLEESRTDTNAIKTCLLEKQEFFSFLEEKGFVLGELLDNELACLESVQELRNVQDECSDKMKFCLFLAGDENKKCVRKLTILRSMHNYWLQEFCEGKEIVLMPYERKSLREILYRWMEEDGYDFSGCICSKYQ